MCGVIGMLSWNYLQYGKKSIEILKWRYDWGGYIALSAAVIVKGEGRGGCLSKLRYSCGNYYDIILNSITFYSRLLCWNHVHPSTKAHFLTFGSVENV